MRITNTLKEVKEFFNNEMGRLNTLMLALVLITSFAVIGKGVWSFAVKPVADSGLSTILLGVILQLAALRFLERHLEERSKRLLKDLIDLHKKWREEAIEHMYNQDRLCAKQLQTLKAYEEIVNTHRAETGR